MISELNDKEINKAHWTGFLNLIHTANAKQVPLFTMSKEEYAEFEDYVKNSPEFDFLAQIDAKFAAAKYIIA